MNECLEALAKQEFVKGEYEIIVVDDGSTDGTKSVFQSFRKKNSCEIHYLYQQNQGQGIARNRGVVAAKGKIVIFIGDDILVQTDFLKQHMEYHRRYHHKNDAVLGLILWDPRIPSTPFMEFMTSGGIFFRRFGGHQFAYDRLLGRELADFNFFYTSNISLKRNLLLQFPFDDSFHLYGWEDIELGYRLTKEAGLKLYYNSHAVVYHYHPMDASSLEDRMRAIGKSAHILHRKYPELRKVPSFWKRALLKFISQPFFLRYVKAVSLKSDLKNDPKSGSKISGKWHLYYYLLSKKAFLEGIEEGIEQRSILQ